MYNIYNTISDIDIPNGSTKRMNCPVCKGYKTFTVTNNMGSLVWNCYKASCDTKGGTRVHLSVDDIRDGFAGAKESSSMDALLERATGREFILDMKTKFSIFETYPKSLLITPSRSKKIAFLLFIPLINFVEFAKSLGTPMSMNLLNF